ncbi:hypothetical protein JCM10212_002965 [Sporobolomyces blumeae]
MASSLKHELKAWEAAFRSEHGRDPKKDDIKQVPDIARKYKEYNKSKSQAATKPPTPAALNGDIFKTPTKPRPSSSRAPSSGHADPATSVASRDAPTNASPTKRSGASRDAEEPQGGRRGAGGHESQPQYVLANSPSKLRALVAMHSKSGSPNRPSGPNWLNAQKPSASTHDPRSKSSDTTGLSNAPIERSSNTSPRKARNPFASPKKREMVTIAPPSRGTTLFGEFEQQERERLRKQKSKRDGKGKNKVKSGMGWGHASEAFPETIESTGDDMAVDEMDDFFGGGSSQKLQKSATKPPSRSSPSLAPAFPSPATTMSNPFFPEESAGGAEDDDEILGPSPVKPSVSSTSNPGSSFQRSISSSPFGFVPANKPFKPLFVDPVPSTSASVAPVSNGSSPAPSKESKPKLFESSLRINADAGPSTASSDGRSLKRSTSSSSTRPGVGDVDSLLDDDDDSFYADALDAAERDGATGANGRNGKKGAAKRTKVAAGGRGRGRARGKGKAKAGDAMDEGEEGEEGKEEDEVRIERDENGGFVLDFRGDEGGAARERVIIRQPGQDPRRSRRDATKARDSNEMDVEAGSGLANDGGEDDDFEHDDVSLLYGRRVPKAIVSSHPQHEPVRTVEPDRSESSTLRESSLPSELASILSLRNSPQKPTMTAKDRQVARLLREPTALSERRRRAGLLELADEEEHANEDEEDEELDDDWDEEVDGWKGAGEAMDGYYSGGDDF